MATASSSFTALPDDVLQRVLLGVALDDHDATAAACRAFRDVIRGPRFLRLRREYGFAERRVIIVGHTSSSAMPFGQNTSSSAMPLEIHVAGKRGAVASIPGLSSINPRGSTTDGGARLFVSTEHHVLALDGTSCQWSRFATLPPNRRLHCLEWHGGLLYVAGGKGEGFGTFVNTFQAFNEATGLWEDLPPMPHACAYAASGVIGNQLFIAGGLTVHNLNALSQSNRALSTLQIYDFAARTWREGAALPHAHVMYGACGIVVGDGKLYLVSTKTHNMQVYDVQSNTWTGLGAPPFGLLDTSCLAMHAFAHEGRIVVVNARGEALDRRPGTGTEIPGYMVPAPRWHQFDLDMVLGIFHGRFESSIMHGVAESVILG